MHPPMLDAWAYFAFRGTHPIRAIHTADGGTGMPAATKRLRGLGMPEKLVPT